MLEGLFDARRVAIIGVSPAEGNIGRFAAMNMHKLGFKGELFLVGRNGGEVLGQPIFRSLADIPGPVDLVNVLVPRSAVADTLEQAGKKGVRFAVVCTSGFSEFSAEGGSAEEQILAVLSKYGMRMVGPNCVGVTNMATGLTTNFGPMPVAKLCQGPVGIIAQSGSVSGKLSELISASGLGFSRFVAVGNKLDLDEADYMHFLAGDPATEVVCFYLEGFRRGEEYIAQAQRCDKPVVAYKSGVTSAGLRLARTHTGAMLSDDRVVDAAFESAGVLRVRSMREVVLACNVLRLPRLAGNRVAVLGPGAGLGVLMSDHCEKLGLTLPPLGASTLEAIKQLGRTDVTQLGSNPFDLGQFYARDSLLQVVRVIAAAPEIDGIVATLPFQEVMTGDGHSDLQGDIAAAACLKQIGAEYNKPIVTAAMIDSPILPEIARAADYPILSDPEDAPAAMALLWRYSLLRTTRERRRTAAEILPERIDRPAAQQFLEDAARGGQRQLGMDCKTALKAYGLPVLEPELATDEQTARQIVTRMGVPVAMKVHSVDVLHKSDVGGVRLNVTGPEDAAKSYREIVAAVMGKIPTARIDGIDVQPMVDRGWEVIVGSRRDAQFGPVVMFGLGGIYAEALNEVSLRMAPVPRSEALEMIGEVRAGRLLSGLRGEKPSDVNALADIIVRVSQLVADFPQIAELDLNPVRVLTSGQGCHIVDARMILESA